MHIAHIVLDDKGRLTCWNMQEWLTDKGLAECLRAVALELDPYNDPTMPRFDPQKVPGVG